MTTEHAVRVDSEAGFLAQLGRDARRYQAPGRVNLIGEHTDYNGGFVMPLNLALHTWVHISPRRDRKVVAFAALFGESVSFDLDEIEGEGDGGWSEYVKGVLWALQEDGYALSGANLLITGNLPIGAGLSSSASLENAVAAAFLELGNHTVAPERVAQLCQKAENEFVGMQCGIMDQFVIAACPRAHAIMLDCGTLEYTPVALPDRMALLVIDSGVKHRHAQGEYNLRRQQSDMAFAQLRRAEPGAKGLCRVSMGTVEAHREQLGDVLYRRARHACSEHRRVIEARDALEGGNARRLGDVLSASHASLRDDYEVSCQEVDALVRLAQSHPHVLGARIVGGGFGGCTVNLVDRENVDIVVRELSEAYESLMGREPWHHLVGPTNPAGRVGA